MQAYTTKKKSAVPATQGTAAESISKSDMLRMSGAGAPQPMSPALREKFEPGFGADFSNIRISRGHIPEELGVQAVAKGTDILMDSRAGMDVLGHELAHVVQQAQGQVRGGFPVVHDAALEHQADVMGARAASGMSAMEGGMSGLGGEMMSIAPMSDASAPAQCKSREEKQREKALKATANPEAARNSAAAAADPARMAREQQAMSAYGAALRADVSAQSEAVTADTPVSSLISGNRLYYMRNNASDPVRDAKKATTHGAMAYTANRFSDYLSSTSGVKGLYEDGAKYEKKYGRDHVLNSSGAVDGVFRDIAANREVDPARRKRAEAIRRKEDSMAMQDLKIWMSMLEEDPHAMKQFQMQVNDVYRPMGTFDAQTNKGGIVGGEQNAGLYAMNDMFLRGGGVQRVENAKRNQLSQKLLNRVFSKSGDLDSMDDQERSLYDTVMAFSSRHAGTGGGTAQGGWRKADVSDAAYSQAPRQMAGSQRNPMNRLKKLGFY